MQLREVRLSRVVKENDFQLGDHPAVASSVPRTQGKEYLPCLFGNESPYVILRAMLLQQVP